MASSFSCLKLLFGSTSLFVLAAAIGVAVLQQTVWYAGYDLANCPGCQATLDWNKSGIKNVTSTQYSQFHQDGVVALSSMLPVEKMQALIEEVEALPSTFMTDAIARFFLPHYLRYEHRLDTRSELVRDWAVHGPFGKWAAELLNVPEVRLYNAESIYHQGQDSPTPCTRAWHRDTIAAPFDATVPSITFNVYFDEIGTAENGDGLMFVKGSHKTMLHQDDSSFVAYDENDDKDKQSMVEPRLVMGDVLAHNPNVYHTPSGRACWKRRSLQFRYVAGRQLNDAREAVITKFVFGPNRSPHGLIPWTLANAPGIAPHGLVTGESDLAGPWYPRVYPSPLKEEHAALKNAKPWSLMAVLRLMKESDETVRGRQGAKDGSDVPSAEDRVHDTPVEGSFGLDGLVMNPTKWYFGELAKGVEVPCLKGGLLCQASQQPVN
jgi:hypothetical protein